MEAGSLSESPSCRRQSFRWISVSPCHLGQYTSLCADWKIFPHRVLYLTFNIDFALEWADRSRWTISDFLYRHCWLDLKCALYSQIRPLSKLQLLESNFDFNHCRYLCPAVAHRRIGPIHQLSANLVLLWEQPPAHDLPSKTAIISSFEYFDNRACNQFGFHLQAALYLLWKTLQNRSDELHHRKLWAKWLHWLSLLICV